MMAILSIWTIPFIFVLVALRVAWKNSSQGNRIRNSNVMGWLIALTGMTSQIGWIIAKDSAYGRHGEGIIALPLVSCLTGSFLFAVVKIGYKLAGIQVTESADLIADQRKGWWWFVGLFILGFILVVAVLALA
jgi:hypothetical protein